MRIAATAAHARLATIAGRRRRALGKIQERGDGVSGAGRMPSGDPAELVSRCDMAFSFFSWACGPGASKHRANLPQEAIVPLCRTGVSAAATRSYSALMQSHCSTRKMCDCTSAGLASRGKIFGSGSSPIAAVSRVRWAIPGRARMLLTKAASIAAPVSAHARNAPGLPGVGRRSRAPLLQRLTARPSITGRHRQGTRRGNVLRQTILPGAALRGIARGPAR